MESKTHARIRRDVLRRGAFAAAGVAFGAPSLAGAASARDDAQDCCKTCWMDVKPGCCPNTIYARKNRLVTVYVGWPNVKLESIRLVPSAAPPMFETRNCQRYRNPKWKGVSCGDIDDLLSQTDGRFARPCRVNVRDVDGDNDGGTVVKVCSCDLEPCSTDRTLLLEAETGSGCRLLAMDSVKPVGCGTANKD